MLDAFLRDFIAGTVDVGAAFNAGVLALALTLILGAVLQDWP